MEVTTAPHNPIRDLLPNFYQIYLRRLALAAAVTFFISVVGGLVFYLWLKNQTDLTLMIKDGQSMLLLRLSIILAALVIAGALVFTYWLWLKNRFFQQESAKLLARSEKIIELNSKMAELGEMSATFAHEIGNPLGILDLALNQLKKEAPTVVELNSYQSSLKALQKMKILIHSVRNYSHECSNVSEQVFARTLEETLILLDYKLSSKEITCIGHVDERLRYRGDPGKMGQVLINLIVNAVHAIEDAPPSERWIRIDSVASSSTSGSVFISNGGDKIDSSLKEKIFIPYFTTKERGKGTGLGLSTCRQLLGKMKIDIELKTEREHTTFELKNFSLLPIEAQAQTPSRRCGQ